MSAGFLSRQIHTQSSSKIKKFFYGLQNITYHIICERIDTVDFNPEHNNNNSNVFVFVCHHQQPDTNITCQYKLTCSKLSTTFVTQYFNMMFYNFEFDQLECLEFS